MKIHENYVLITMYAYTICVNQILAVGLYVLRFGSALPEKCITYLQIWIIP